MNIHIIVSLSTLFFGFGYAYGDSRKLSFVKILMTLIVVAPLGFQIYQSYASKYFVVTALSLGAGFYLGWNKEFGAGEWLLSLKRAVPKSNFRNNSGPDEAKEQGKARSGANKQEELDRERRRRADEMKKEREREQAKGATEDDDKKEHESQQHRKKGTGQKEKPPNPKPPVKPPNPEPKDRRTPEEILGLKPGWTKQELRQAYHREIKRWHMDSAMNKPEALRAVAEEEAKKVNIAHDILKRRV